MNNLDLEMRLIELEMKLYNAVNDVVINAVTEKYKNISPDRISYSLPVIDGKSNSAPKSSSLTREERLRYMKECQKNWHKPIPGGGRK